VRFIGDPDQRIAEDRLRVYRFFRFTASHGQEQFDPDGLMAVGRAAGTLGDLSAERVGAEIRRMLSLPKVWRTVEAMADAKVLDLPEHVVAWLGTYERRAHKPNLQARLSLLVSALGAKRVQDRWRLPNEDIGIAESILAAARLMIEFHLNEAAYRYPAALADAVDVAATLAGWTEAGKSAVLQRLEMIDVARFPINGNDLMALGMKAGPALGAELERLERIWIESNFKLDRDALLADVRR
jgi:poly(A) polymerase